MMNSPPPRIDDPRSCKLYLTQIEKLSFKLKASPNKH